MSGWQRCDRCRKVRPADDYDAGLPTCRECLTAPTRRRTAAPVTTRASRATTADPEIGPRAPRLGSVGMGDLEVRAKRAKRAAYDALVAAHEEEFEQLHQAARAAEGLRPS
ncbi:MAG TPA: hypothetical protein VNA30_04540 [Mycobacteriales bacterium]|nr:hypothetical protein [Mycobacteriales bacterium]